MSSLHERKGAVVKSILGLLVLWLAGDIVCGLWHVRGRWRGHPFGPVLAWSNALGDDGQWGLLFIVGTQSQSCPRKEASDRDEEELASHI